jgi:hypothetical protein
MLLKKTHRATIMSTAFCCVVQGNWCIACATRSLQAPRAGEYPKSVHQHGLTRRKQGYSAAMLVAESHMPQISIFNTLGKNHHRVDFNLLLLDVMVMAR